LRQNLKPEDQKLLNELAASRSQLAALLFKGTGNLPPTNTASKLPPSKPKLTNSKASSRHAAPSSAPNPTRHY
jgi:hypothetical protein